MHLAFDIAYGQVSRNNSTYERKLRAGMWAAATLFENEKAANFCEREGIKIKAQATTNNVAGGFLIPAEIEDLILANATAHGVFRREANVRPIGSSTREFPRRVGGLTAAFVDEGAAAPESEGAFDSVHLRPRKLVGLTRASSELVEDSIADLGAWLIEEFGEMFASVEDGCGWNGDGSSSFGKMRGIATLLADGQHAGGVPAGAGHSTFAQIDAADIANVMTALPEAFLPSAKWFCSAHAQAQALVRLGAMPFGVIQTPTGPRPMMQLAGYPIVPTPKLPGAGSQTGRAMMAFGDLRSAAIFGSRKQLTIKASQSRFLERDQTAFKAVERFEIVCHGLGSATAAGAMVALIGG